MSIVLISIFFFIAIKFFTIKKNLLVLFLFINLKNFSISETLIIETYNIGNIEIQLLNNVAPKNIEIMKKLIDSSFYNDLYLMKNNDMKILQIKTNKKIPPKIAKQEKINPELTYKYTHKRGAFSIPKDNFQDFFITLEENSSLDDNHSIAGYVKKKSIKILTLIDQKNTKIQIKKIFIKKI